mgnify:FL=1
MWTFPSWYWFKKGTILETGFRELNKAPVYDNPNVEFPRGRPVVMHNRDRRFKQELKLPKSYAEEDVSEGGESSGASEASKLDNMSRKIVPNPRNTEADKQGDLSSLERKLARTLYLIVSLDGKKWEFPTFEVASEGSEASEGAKPLHILAEEGLYQLGGENINYFNVSNTPCHVETGTDGNKAFLIKLHILGGSFVPQNGEKFLWLSKEELGEHLNKEYYENVKHLLSDV